LDAATLALPGAPVGTGRVFSEALKRVIEVVKDLGSGKEPVRSEGLSAQGESEPRVMADEATRQLVNQLGPYRVRRQIGRGGMGVVFEAEDQVLRRPVAIKVLDPQRGLNEAARARFLREARAAAALSHENIVAIYGVGQARGIPYLVLQYVEGESLAERLRRCKRLPIEDVVRLGTEVARGLSAAHAQGRIHRDIKPANILLEHATGRAKIADFGLAKEADDQGLTMEGTIAGTPEFMSPEQACGHALDARTDLFSLGVVLYLAATGHSPFAASDPWVTLDRVRQAKPQPLQALDPSLPRWFCEVVSGLLTKKPSDRIESAEVLVGLLERCQKPASKPRRRIAQAAIIAGGLLLAGLAAAILLPRQPPQVRPAPAPFKPPASGFVIAGRPIVFAGLDEAVAAARDHDVIEVYGGGPYSCPPIQNDANPLTIRAMGSSRPVLVSQTPSRPSPAPLITTNADLRLEGLTIRWMTETPPSNKNAARMLLTCAVAATRGSLSLSDCRILAGEETACVAALGGELVLHRCHLVSQRGAVVFWQPKPEAQLRLQGCSLEGHAGLTLLTASAAIGLPAASVHMEQNTFAVDRSIQLVIQLGPKQTLQVTALNNLFDNRQLFSLHATRIPRRLLPDTPEEIMRQLLSMVRWREMGNVHRRGETIGLTSVLPRAPHATASFADLGAWLRHWKLPPTASIEGVIRFQRREGADDEALRLERVDNPSGPLPHPAGANPDQVGPRNPGLE
jgi:hypothetical protein